MECLRDLWSTLLIPPIFSFRLRVGQSSRGAFQEDLGGRGAQDQPRRGPVQRLQHRGEAVGVSWSSYCTLNY